MEGYEYEKTLLYAYPQMKAVAEAVAAGAEIKAALSYRAVWDAFTVAEQVADEILRSRRLEQIKEELDGILARFSDYEQFLLEYKYFRRKKLLKGRFAGYTAGCSEREYYRRQRCVLAKFSRLLSQKGWSEEKFLQEFQGFSPYLRIYRALKKGRENALVERRARRELAFSQKSALSSRGAGLRLPRTTNTATAAADRQITHTATICAGEREDVFPDSAGGSSVPETAER